MEDGPRQGAVPCPQLGQCNLFPAREVRVVRRGLRVRVAVCAGSLHCSGAFSSGGSGAGQVDRRLCLGAFGCRAVGQLVGRLVSSDVGVAWDPLEGDGHALVHQRAARPSQTRHARRDSAVAHPGRAAGAGGRRGSRSTARLSG